MKSEHMYFCFLFWLIFDQTDVMTILIKPNIILGAVKRYIQWKSDSFKELIPIFKQKSGFYNKMILASWLLKIFAGNPHEIPFLETIFLWKFLNYSDLTL